MQTFVFLILLSIVVFTRSQRKGYPCKDSMVMFGVRLTAEVLTSLFCVKLLVNHGLEIMRDGWTSYRQTLVSQIM